MENKNEVAIIKAEDFGLKPEQGTNITKDLKLVLSERDELEKQYLVLIKSPINSETAKKAKELRMLYVKNRTQGIDPWHTAQKAYWKSGGDFVDATKRKEIFTNQRCEANLLEIEKFEENQERERLDKIENARKSILLEEFPDVNFGAYDLRNMTPESFQQLFQDQTDLKELREAKALKEEEERLALEAKNTLRETRRKECFFLGQFIKDWETIDFADLDETDYENLVLAAEADKFAHDQKQAKIEAENKRLKEEADKKAKEESDRIAKENGIRELQTVRLNKLLPFNIAANNKIDLSKLGELTVEDYNRILTNKKQDWQKLQDAEKLAKDKAEAEKKATEAAAAKAQKELADKKAEEEKLAKQKLDEEAAKLKMGDAEKWVEFTTELKALFAKYEFQSETYKKRAKLLKNTNAAIVASDVNQPLNVNIA
jgi:hypothetical protein